MYDSTWNNFKDEVEDRTVEYRKFLLIFTLSPSDTKSLDKTVPDALQYLMKETLQPKNNTKK